MKLFSYLVTWKRRIGNFRNVECLKYTWDSGQWLLLYEDTVLFFRPSRDGFHSCAVWNSLAYSYNCKRHAQGCAATVFLGEWVVYPGRLPLNTE